MQRYIYIYIYIYMYIYIYIYEQAKSQYIYIHITTLYTTIFATEDMVISFVKGMLK